MQRPPWRHCLPVALALLAAGCYAQPGAPSLAEDFEEELKGWLPGDQGTPPLELVTDRAFSGERSAYSGPPGVRHVMTRWLPAPLVGRLEVRFYDDMAPQKHQIAAASGVGAPGEAELLGIVCRGGQRYQCRVGQTYADVPVERSEGWHLLAWECDGRRTIAYIDDVEVFVNDRMGRIARVSLGSFWDDSTGWYDDLRVFARPPTEAGPFVEAEFAFRNEGGPADAGVPLFWEGQSGPGALRWRTPGQVLEWALSTAQPGRAMLVLRHEVTSGTARVRFELAGEAFETELQGVAAVGQWRYTGIPVQAPEGVATLRGALVKGEVHLDWLALTPPDIDASAYGPLLSAWLGLTAWERKGQEMLAARAHEAGVQPLEPPPDPSNLTTLGSGEELAQLIDEAAHEQAETRTRVLAAEVGKLQGIYRVREPKALGPETPLSREAYRRLLRYLRLTAPRFAAWPHAEGCQYHKVDGHDEWAVRQNATVALGYSTLLAGEFDPEIAGVPREQIARDLNELLRYISITHKANLLPTGDGEPWGDQWQSAFWARIAGTAAWFAWEVLDDDVRAVIARMVIHEADRFNDRPPDSGVLHDTKAEENAWNSEVIAVAACMFPDHPHNALWQERAIVYMLNSFTREADRADARAVDGKPVHDRVSAVTIHPDFTLENHNRVHPDYMGTTGLLLRNALVYGRTDLGLPESMFYNVREVWSVLKGLTATNGSLFYINGQDWWPHRHDVPLTNAALMSVLCDDPDAAFIELADLDFTGLMHARFEDGRMWDSREYNYRNAEEEMVARYSELYLLHRLFGDGPEPSTREQFLQSQSGTRVYETGGFVVHRTPAKLCSFAWANGAMGLVYPSDDTWFASPSERGMVGAIACEGLKDTTAVVEERKLGATEDGFALALRIARCEGKVEQAVAVFSLPDEPVFYLERLTAREAVTVREVATGTAPILNEDAPGIAGNQRTVACAEGTAEVPGVGGEDRLLRWQTGWANLDGKLGVVSTTGTMAYRDRKAYARSRLEEELIANCLADVGDVGAGGEISGCAVAFIPNQSAAETEGTRLEWERVGEALVAARLGEAVVVANLARERVEGEVFGSRVSLDPLGTSVVTR